ncbi:hypothetical protein LXL04_029952 [Taraxacum kok-saghyz]
MIMRLLYLHFFFIFFNLASSSPSTPPSDFALFGTTTINHTSIILTQHLKNCISSNIPDSNIGRVFYKHPIHFLDSSFNATDSFWVRFTFTIIPPPPPCFIGEGFAFLITSNPNYLPHSNGGIGLPKSLDQNTIAIEFDTKLDLDPGDINDNHVGIDLDSIFSVASIDLKMGGINLKSGRQITVGYNQKLLESPILVAVPIDLTKRLDGSMYVGFSAANGRGSSIHMIHSLHFKRAKSLSPIQHEAFWSENCLICFPEDVIREEGETGLRNNHRSFKRVLALSLGLLFALFLIWVRLIRYLVSFFAMRRYLRFREKRIRRIHRWMMMP